MPSRKLKVGDYIETSDKFLYWKGFGIIEEIIKQTDWDDSYWILMLTGDRKGYHSSFTRDEFRRASADEYMVELL